MAQALAVVEGQRHALLHVLPREPRRQLARLQDDHAVRPDRHAPSLEVLHEGLEHRRRVDDRAVVPVVDAVRVHGVVVRGPLRGDVGPVVVDEGPHVHDAVARVALLLELDDGGVWVADIAPLDLEGDPAR